MVLNRRTLRGMTVVIGTMVLVLSVSTSGLLAQETPECAIWVQPGESIQQAIDQAAEGAVICLAEGEWKECITIEKSLTLQGAGQGQIVVKAKEECYPAVWIKSDLEIEVTLREFHTGFATAEDLGVIRCLLGLGRVCPDGIRVGGKTKLSLKNVQISDNRMVGLYVDDSAQVVLTNTTVSGNGDGLWVGGSAQVSLIGATVSRNMGVDLVWMGGWGFPQGRGLWVEGSAQVKLITSAISDNRLEGLWIDGMAEVNLTSTTVSGNGGGIALWHSAQATIQDSTIEGNGYGIDIRDSAMMTLEGTKISNNGDYGLALYKRPCFDTDNTFTGYVTGKKNTITDNKKGDVCPAELRFLTTKEGGELDRRK